MPLKSVINRPASECDSNAIHIGPTAVDFSMLPSAARIPSNEDKEIKAWRARTAAYHSRRSSRYVNPKHPEWSF